MPDVLTPDQRHQNMAAIHSTSTMPELNLRRALWQLGFRYRINDKRLPGKPDIVLPKYRTVIFVHGCFWHGHSGCKFYTVPKTNTEFWTSKIARNQKRDQEVWRMLEAKGWFVIVVWECKLRDKHIQNTVDNISSEIYLNGMHYRKTLEERRNEQKEYRKSLKLKKERYEAFKKLNKR